MNICQVIFAGGWGGAEAWVHELTMHLRDKGENVSLILNEEIVKYYNDLDNINLFNIGTLYPPKSIIPHRKLKRIKSDLIRKALSPFYDYLDELLCYKYFNGIRKKMIQWLSINQIGLIHSHNPLATIFAAKLGDLKIPNVATEHGAHVLRGVIPVHPIQRPLTNLRARMFSKALGQADRVTVPSNYMRKALEDWGIPLTEKPLVIPIGINVSEIQSTLKTTLKLKGEFNLFFPGGPKWIKGGDLILEALAKVRDKIPDVHLYIGLYVPPYHMLRKMTNTLALENNVTFTSFLSRRSYLNLLNSVDLFVFPSRLDAYPLAVIEAIVLGKPIIASSVGGIPEIINDGRNGILVKPEVDGIAQAILCLYGNQSLREEMIKNNMKDSARFDSSSRVDQYIRFYSDMLKSAN